MNNLIPAEQYLEYFNRITGLEAKLYQIESLIPDLPPVTTLVYKDYPREGLVTGITYGISLVDHPDWKDSRPELCFCIESHSTVWAQVAGLVGNKLRGKSSLPNGQLINLGKPVTEGTQISAFFIHTPSIFDKSQYQNINIGYDYHINLLQLYPVLSSELELFKEIGADGFIKNPSFKYLNINRNPIKE